MCSLNYNINGDAREITAHYLVSFMRLMTKINVINWKEWIVSLKRTPHLENQSLSIYCPFNKNGTKLEILRNILRLKMTENESMYFSA